MFDEFQEIAEIDPNLPKLMRSVFQEQPEVAHVHLGSKRHMMERIFNDENEPFWRSAKQISAAASQRLVLQALASEPGRPLSAGYRRRHNLPGASSVQRALEALVKGELVARRNAEYRIVEPFLAEWILSPP